MKKTIIDALMVSSVAVITLRLGYGVESLPVLGGAHLSLGFLSYYLLSLTNKETKAVREQYYQSLLNQLFAQQTILQDAQKKGMELLRRLGNEYQTITETQTQQIAEMNLLQREIALQASEQRDGIKRDLAEGVFSMKETASQLRKLGAIEEQCIDLNGSFRSFSGIVDQLQGVTEEISELLAELKEQNREQLKDLKEALKKSGDKAEALADKYRAHQAEFAEKMLEISVNNENIVNMLEDQYKVLHEIAASI